MALAIMIGRKNVEKLAYSGSLLLYRRPSFYKRFISSLFIP